MDEILADYYEAELELLAGFLQKVTAAGVIAAALPARPPHCRGCASRTYLDQIDLEAGHL
jgi:hypothetical protein